MESNNDLGKEKASNSSSNLNKSGRDTQAGKSKNTRKSKSSASFKINDAKACETGPEKSGQSANHTETSTSLDDDNRSSPETTRKTPSKTQHMKRRKSFRRAKSSLSMSSDTSSTSNVCSKPTIAIPKVEMMSRIDSTEVNDDDLSPMKEEQPKKSVSFGDGPSYREISRENTPVQEEIPTQTSTSGKDKSFSAPEGKANSKLGKENKGNLATKTNDSQQTILKQNEKHLPKRTTTKKNILTPESPVVEKTTVVPLVESNPDTNLIPTSATNRKASITPQPARFEQESLALPPIHAIDQDNFGSSVAKPKLTGDDLPKMADFLPDIRARIEELTRPKRKGKNSRQQSANPNSETIVLGMLNPAGDNKGPADGHSVLEIYTIDGTKPQPTRFPGKRVAIFGIGKKGVTRAVTLFKDKPKSRPLDVCFDFPNSSFSHRHVYDLISKVLMPIEGAAITGIQYQDRNVQLGTRTMDNRWIISVNSVQARNELVRRGLNIFHRKTPIRLYDDVICEDYMEFIDVNGIPESNTTEADKLEEPISAIPETKHGAATLVGRLQGKSAD